MNNVKYYCRKADELRLLAGRVKEQRDYNLLIDCARLLDKLAGVEDAMYPDGENNE